jgi:hypothetical protein
MAVTVTDLPILASQLSSILSEGGELVHSISDSVRSEQHVGVYKPAAPTTSGSTGSSVAGTTVTASVFAALPAAVQAQLIAAGVHIVAD